MAGLAESSQIKTEITKNIGERKIMQKIDIIISDNLFNDSYCFKDTISNVHSSYISIELDVFLIYIDYIIRNIKFFN